MIQQFENHSNNESFLQDLNKTEERSARGRKSWSPTCIVYCSCGRSLKNLAKDQTVGQEELWRLMNSRLRHQKEPHPWCQTWSFLAATHVHQSQGNRCCRMVANPNMVVPKPSWKDGTRMTNTASLCHFLGGLKSKLFRMTNMHWKTTPPLQQERKELVTRNVGYSRWTKKVFRDHWINVLISLKQNEN